MWILIIAGILFLVSFLLIWITDSFLKAVFFSAFVVSFFLMGLGLNVQSKNQKKVECESSIFQEEPIDSIIVKTARKYKIPPALMLAIAEVESNKNPMVIGDKGMSFGLFQINLHYEKELLLNPWINSEMAALALSRWYLIFGSWELAAQAHNAGYKKNPAYLSKVKAYWKKYEELLNSKRPDSSKIK